MKLSKSSVRKPFFLFMPPKSHEEFLLSPGQGPPTYSLFSSNHNLTCWPWANKPITFCLLSCSCRFSTEITEWPALHLHHVNTRSAPFKPFSPKPSGEVSRCSLLHVATTYVWVNHPSFLFTHSHLFSVSLSWLKLICFSLCEKMDVYGSLPQNNLVWSLSYH